MENKISIIIPVYNVEKYIDECLKSIQGQTYTNWEAIIVDDGSTDLSGKICDQYADKDERFIVIHQKNARIAAARNKGLDVATGDFITFIDSDDFIENTTFEKCVNIFSKDEQLDVIQWDVEFYYDGESKPRRNANKEPAAYVEILASPDKALKYLVDMRNEGNHPDFNNLWNDCRCVWTKMCKKHIFDELRFPIGKEYEDDYICHKIFGQSKKVMFINERFSKYRYRSNSTVRAMNLKGKVDKVYCELDRLLYIEKKDYLILMPDAVHNYFTSVMNIYSLLASNNQLKEYAYFLKDYKNYFVKYCKYLYKKEYFIFKLFYVNPLIGTSILKIYRKINLILGR